MLWYDLFTFHAKQSSDKSTEGLDRFVSIRANENNNMPSLLFTFCHWTHELVSCVCVCVRWQRAEDITHLERKEHISSPRANKYKNGASIIFRLMLIRATATKRCCFIYLFMSMCMCMRIMYLIYNLWARVCVCVCSKILRFWPDAWRRKDHIWIIKRTHAHRQRERESKCTKCLKIWNTFKKLKQLNISKKNWKIVDDSIWECDVAARGRFNYHFQ